MSLEPLIHVGYHKTGTTWLQERLFSMDDLGFAQLQPRMVIDEAFIVRNPFDFDPADARGRVEPFITEAQAQGRVAVLSHERLSGLPLENIRTDAAVLADRLFAALPDARVLIVIREQRDMMISLYKHHVRAFGTDRFDRLWRERTLRERRAPRPGLDVLEYHHLISYYRDRFGPERVLVLPFEILKEDPLVFAGRICGFVGLASPTEISPDRDNAALPAGAIAMLRYLNVLMRLVGIDQRLRGPIEDSSVRSKRLAILRRIGPAIPDALSRRVDRRWRADVARIVGDRFERSNARVAEMCGLDLASFGYALEGTTITSARGEGL